MIELADIHLLKRRPIIEIADPILLDLNELQKVLKAPSVTFKKIMVYLSCATRFNLQEGGTPNAATPYTGCMGEIHESYPAALV